MFQSETKDSLFKDGTQCLVVTQKGETHKEFLGKNYLDAVAGLKKCSTSGTNHNLKCMSLVQLCILNSAF